jgi:hypothetical protein
MSFMISPISLLTYLDDLNHHSNLSYHQIFNMVNLDSSPNYNPLTHIVVSSQLLHGHTPHHVGNRIWDLFSDRDAYQKVYVILL